MPQHRVCGYLIDRQEATGRLNGLAGSAAEFDAWGENFRAIIVEPPTVPLSPRGGGCVTFYQTPPLPAISACGLLLTTNAALASAQVTGSAVSGNYKISVSVTLTGVGVPEAEDDIVGVGCIPPYPVPPVQPTPSATPTTIPTVPVPPTPSASPSPPSLSRVCFAKANPSLERSAVTSGVIRLLNGTTEIGRAYLDDEGLIQYSVLAELDAGAP